MAGARTTLKMEVEPPILHRRSLEAGAEVCIRAVTGIELEWYCVFLGLHNNCVGGIGLGPRQTRTKGERGLLPAAYRLAGCSDVLRKGRITQAEASGSPTEG